MFIEERHKAILDIIHQNGRISIGEIQDKFEVSVDSARRDLRLLEERGLLKRTHGARRGKGIMTKCRLMSIIMQSQKKPRK